MSGILQLLYTLDASKPSGPGHTYPQILNHFLQNFKITLTTTFVSWWKEKIEKEFLVVIISVMPCTIFSSNSDCWLWYERAFPQQILSDFIILASWSYMNKKSMIMFFLSIYSWHDARCLLKLCDILLCVFITYYFEASLVIALPQVPVFSCHYSRAGQECIDNIEGSYPSLIPVNKRIRILWVHKKTPVTTAHCLNY